MMYFSFACSIEFEDKVIVTGGFFTEKTVSVYDIEGWVKDLPSLQRGRYNHGCGHYVNDKNKIVRFLIN